MLLDHEVLRALPTWSWAWTYSHWVEIVSLSQAHFVCLVEVAVWWDLHHCDIKLSQGFVWDLPSFTTQGRPVLLVSTGMLKGTPFALVHVWMLSLLWVPFVSRTIFSTCLSHSGVQLLVLPHSLLGSTHISCPRTFSCSFPLIRGASRDKPWGGNICAYCCIPLRMDWVCYGLFMETNTKKGPQDHYRHS